MLLLAGIIIAITSYNFLSPTGYYIMHYGFFAFGIYWTVSGIYNITHPKKKFEDVNPPNVMRKIILFVIILTITVILSYIARKLIGQ